MKIARGAQYSSEAALMSTKRFIPPMSCKEQGQAVKRSCCNAAKLIQLSSE